MLTNSMMLPLISEYEENRLDRWEVLFSQYGVFGAFLDQSTRPDNIISPMNREKLYYSWGNTVPIVVIDGNDLTIGNTYSCNISDVINTTQKITPTFTQYAWGMNQYPDEYAVGGQPLNYVQQQQDFTNKNRKFLKAFMDTLDTSCRNALEANKNTYWTTNIANYYAVVGDAIQIPQSAKNDAFNQLSAVMNEMDLYESCIAISSTSLKPLTTRLEAQGDGNATNERFQFKLGTFIFTGSNRVTNNANVQSTTYLCQPGSISIFNRNAPPFINNREVPGGSIAWSTIEMPMFGMKIGTFYKASCAASPSGTSYLNQVLQSTLVEGFGFTTEVGTLTPYNSRPTTKVTPIVKVEIAN